MKVILLQDVAKIGRRFDVVNVPDGYGFNKLIPQGMAKPATPENLKAIKAQTANKEANQAQADEAFAALTEKLKDAVIVLKVEANEEGRMFQALKAEDIATEMSAQTGSSVSADQVVINEPIKAVGEHDVLVASGQARQAVTITVEAK